MKRNIISIMLICIILFVSGCRGENSTHTGATHNANAESLASYLKSLDMPKMLNIAFNPDDISKLTSAKEYAANWLKLDLKKVVDSLFKNTVLETGAYAQGPWMRAGDGQKSEEYLVIYNGVIHGGLSYTLNDDGVNSLQHKLMTVIDPNPGFPDAVAQTLLYSKRTDYKTNHNLDFISYQKALTDTEKVLTECGFPALSVQDVYSLDLETMCYHYQQYMKANKNENAVNQYLWSKNDECYLLQFRQAIDGIPCINTMWEEGTRVNREATETPIYAIYAKNGLISIQASGLYTKVSEIKAESIISAVQAFQIYINDYMKSIPISETKILSLELNYIGTYDGEGIHLVPAWVFCTSHSVKEKNADQPVDVYTYYILNAFTAKRIRSAVDSQ